MATINAPTQVVNGTSSSSHSIGSYRDPSAESQANKDKGSSTDVFSALGLNASLLTSYQYQFVNSPSVKQAVDLFLSCPNPDIWLSRLAAIVNSIVTPHDNNFGDNAFNDLGTFLGGDKEGTAALNTAYNNLNNLLSQFYEWFNKLPAEQRQQFEAAGMNIALDGGSMLTGSDAPAASAEPSSAVDASNVSFDNALNFVTSTADGLLSLVGLVNNVFSLRQQKRSLDITENSTLSNVNLQRLALGLSPLSSLSDVNSSKVQDADEFSPFGIKSSNEAEAGSKKSRIALETEVNPLYDAVDDATRLSIGPYNEIMAELGNILLGQKIYQTLYDKEKLAFDSKRLEINSQIQSEYGSALATGEAQTALAELSAEQVEFRTSSKLKEFGEQLYDYKKAMLSDWIEKANSDSPDAFIYSSILMKSGLQMTDFMGPADTWLNYFDKGSGILDDILGVFSPAKWLRPKKVFKNYNTETKTTIYK